MRQQRGAAPSLDLPPEATEVPFALVASAARAQRMLLTQLLRRCGFEVAKVRDENEALDRIGDFLISRPPRYFDLVVVDLRVRQRSGLSLFLRLRHGDWRPPVIVIVAGDDQALREEAHQHGALAVLEWPFEFARFERAVLAARQQQLQKGA
jgi:DNA-binding response OmpR family regulator